MKEITVFQKAKIIQQLRQNYSLTILLSVANIARSTFYYQLKRECREDKYSAIKKRIYQIYDQHKKRYGYRRVMYTLRNEGTIINHKTVLKLMRGMGLKSQIRKKKYTYLKVENGVTSTNILERNFYAQAPNEKWVTDFTQFNINGKRLYLTPIMDLYNGEIIAFNTSTRYFFDSVEKILNSAAKQLKHGESPILHSDQG